MKQTMSLSIFVLTLISLFSCSGSLAAQSKNKIRFMSNNQKHTSKSHFVDEDALKVDFSTLHQDKNDHFNRERKRRLSEMEQLADKTPLVHIPTDLNKIVNNHETLNVAVEGWMKIASRTFPDKVKTPIVLLRSYKKKKLPIGVSNFRYNEYYTGKKYGDSDYPPSKFDFYFRYSDKNLYYTSHKKSLYVLGQMSVLNIKVIKDSSDPNETGCIKLVDGYNVDWSVCPETSELKKKLFCKIKEDLDMLDTDCQGYGVVSKEPIIMEKKVKQPIILIPLPTRNCNEKWNFDKKGEDWECDCKEGMRQSPIDIPTLSSGDIHKSPVKPIFKYDTVEVSADVNREATKIIYEDGMLKIKNNTFGKVVTLDGVIYQATEVRFHTPSEHKLNGKFYDMEIQVIHNGVTKGDLAKQLILSILVEKYPGVYNQFLDDVDPFDLPNPLNKEINLKNNLHLNKIFYRSDEEGSFYYMKPFNFFTYEGSLTAPPCSENTIHVVSATPIQLSTTVVSLFKEALKIPDLIDEKGNIQLNATTEKENSRKLQPLNGRRVYFYDANEKDPIIKAPKKDESEKGHFEKVKKTYTAYFHVDSENPSNLPGAFVVPEQEAKGNTK